MKSILQSFLFSLLFLLPVMGFSADPVLGTPFNFTPTSATVNQAKVAVLDANRYFIAYSDSTNGVGKAVVATVNGSDITYGTPIIFNNVTNTGIFDVISLTANKAVIMYKNGIFGEGMAIVAQLSGNTISLGTPVAYTSVGAASGGIAKLSNNRFAVAFRGQSNFGIVRIGNVSGSNISYGQDSIFNAFPADGWNVKGLSSNTFLVRFSGQTSSNNANAMRRGLY